MPVPIYNVRFNIGTFNADVDCWQWGYNEGKDYIERVFGTTPYGHFYRSKVGKSRRMFTITFVKNAVTSEILRTLSLIAMRSFGNVTFYQDLNDVSTAIVLDWQTALEKEIVFDDREAIQVNVQEHLV